MRSESAKLKREFEDASEQWDSAYPDNRCSCGSRSGVGYRHEFKRVKNTFKECDACIDYWRMPDLVVRWVAVDPESVFDHLYKAEHPTPSKTLLAGIFWSEYSEKDAVSTRKKWELFCNAPSNWLSEAGIQSLGKIVATSSPKEFVHEFIPKWGIKVGSIIQGYWNYAEVDPEAAIQAIRLSGDPDVQELARYGVGRGYAGRDMNAAYAWASSLETKELTAALSGVLTTQLLDDSAGAAEIFARIPQAFWKTTGYYPIKVAVAEYATHNPVNAAQWAATNLAPEIFNSLYRGTWAPQPSRVPVIGGGWRSRLDDELAEMNQHPFHWSVETCVKVLDILWEKDQTKRVFRSVESWCAAEVDTSLQQLRSLPVSNGHTFLKERPESYNREKAVSRTR